MESSIMMQTNFVHRDNHAPKKTILLILNSSTIEVVIFCAAVAAAHTSLVGPLGLGAPVLAAGPLGLGLGKGLIAAPAVATVSSQRTAINHVAPATPIGAAAPIALAKGLIGNGLIGNGLIANRVLGNGILANGIIGNGLVANRVIGNGYLGNGVIAGNGILANGLVAGHGIAGAPLAIGTGLLGAPVGLGVGNLGLGLAGPLGLGLGKAIL
ncbi:uncharacterized protein CDAR_278381 [Caerostris darwini]|uniref:Uncharacterized protein n=1 Tax=Caerostris darwini TaxID=1538125 RepID=A0AAV4WRS7_9ARAC|nr:uncharacterized protein CDAR_278381 [Caerostris darwini]